MTIKHGTKWMGLIMGGCMAFAACAETVTIMATVNDDVITSIDVAERRALVMSNANIPDTPENQQKITPRVIQLLVDESLEMQEAKKQGVKVTDDEVNKAIDTLGAPQAPSGAVRAQLIERGLSIRSFTEQMRAQLAWGKVVRKFRRNVTITQDEIERAQKAQAAAPGTEEMHLAVLAIAITAPDKEAEAQAIAKEVQSDLASGRDLSAVAEKYRSKQNVQYNPGLWVTEDRTPPALYELIKQKKNGEQIGPVRTGPIIQFVKILDRRVTKKSPAGTEVLVKQITIDAPPKADRTAAAKLGESEKIIRANPGNCDDKNLPATPMPAHADYARAKLGALTAEQQSLVNRLEVGGLSEPQMGGDKMLLIMLCERSESQGAAGIDDELRQQLFNEKIELEAQKRLRDLKREAAIDIRDPK